MELGRGVCCAVQWCVLCCAVRVSSGPVQCRGLQRPALMISALPEGSCTELPRGPSLCPARGSSVQDASGWESARSEEALWPQHSTNWVVAIQIPKAWLWGQVASRRWLSAFCKKWSPLPPEPPEMLTWGFLTHLSTWAKKRTGGSSERIKLDLTPQQLKEVTALTPALPGVPPTPGFEG